MKILEENKSFKLLSFGERCKVRIFTELGSELSEDYGYSADYHNSLKLWSEAFYAVADFIKDKPSIDACFQCIGKNEDGINEGAEGFIQCKKGNKEYTSYISFVVDDDNKTSFVEMNSFGFIRYKCTRSAVMFCVSKINEYFLNQIAKNAI